VKRSYILFVLMAQPLLWVVMLSARPVNAQAPAVVIHDSGQTLPIAPYLAPLYAEQVPARRRSPANPPLQNATPMSAMFPLKTTLLAPGKISPTNVKMLMPMPIFVVGDDPMSRAWIKRNSQVLFDLQATGIVIKAATEADFWALRNAYPALRMVPSHGDDLNRTFGLRAYPFLIKSDGEVVQ
jgi:integrating conjugative element protein (TIGR03765 family)